MRIVSLAPPVLAFAAALTAQDAFKDVQSRISDFTLDNGWKFRAGRTMFGTPSALLPN